MASIECDLLLFVATSTEFDELKRAATESGLDWRKQASPIGEFWSIGRLGGYRVVVVRTEIGAIGPTGSTRQAHFYLAATGAQGIVCLGMAFGISRQHQPLGTVLVSDSLFRTTSATSWSTRIAVIAGSIGTTRKLRATRPPRTPPRRSFAIGCGVTLPRRRCPTRCSSGVC
ncbi:MAG TPA: hypothetical protein VGD37_20420 [Kofleriaceae bacterium]|jgi:nucleoside phosphorylase